MYLPSLSHISVLATCFDFVKNGGNIYALKFYPHIHFLGHDIKFCTSPLPEYYCFKSEIASLARNNQYRYVFQDTEWSILKQLLHALILNYVSNLLNFVILTFLFSDHTFHYYLMAFNYKILILICLIEEFV